MKPKRILAAAAIMLAFSPLHAVFYESELNADDPNYVENLERALEEYVGGKREAKDYIPSHNRAFELALYYAGYPREVFLKIDYYIPPDMWDHLPPPKIRNLKRGKMRDAKKAMEYAKIAREIAPWDMRRASEVLIKSFEFEGIGTKQKFDVMYDYDKHVAEKHKELIDDCEKLEQRYKTKPSPRLKKYLERAKRSLEIWDSLKFGAYNSENADFWYVYRIYVHYNGAFGFERDLKKARDYILMSRDWIWLNFYTGFNVPRDEELAKHILRIQNTEQSLKFLKEIEETGKVNIPRKFGICGD